MVVTCIDLTEAQITFFYLLKVTFSISYKCCQFKCILLTGLRYKMVIICGSEDTSNSKIVAFLEKYRRPPLPLMSDQVLLPYLQEKLKVIKQNPNVKESVYPAGYVDFERYIVSSLL